MEKKKIEIIITSVLVIVFILVFISSTKKIKKKSALVSAPADQPAVLGPVSISAVLPQDVQSKQLEFKNLEWIRDPFSDKIYLSHTGEVDLHVTGILWDKNKPSAIISNRIVVEGDIVGEYTVFKIKKESVILNDGTKNIEINIGK